MLAGIGVLILDVSLQSRLFDHFYSECERIAELNEITSPKPYQPGKQHGIALGLQICLFLAASTCLTCYGILGL
jgi:hypothetical protein